MSQFRFAVEVKNVLTGDAWRTCCQKAEALGYSTVVMPDHVGHHLAAMPAMTAAAAVTTNLRVSSLVLANDLRHPAMLAKEAATVDVLSDGRFDLAIGTGWYPPDYDMLGMSIDPAPDRVSRLAESVALLKRLWTEDEVNHEGAHYTVRGASIRPRVVQSPHPPVLIGGAKPRMLRLAAREADIVSISAVTTASEVETMLDTVRAAAGRRFDRIELQASCDFAIVDDPTPLYENAAADHNAELAEITDSPCFMYGPLEMLRDRLLAARDKFGFTYFVIPLALAEEFAPLARELASLPS
jgi:probable F420-dependent oxidoreductase